jgi:hypothetical protein
LTDTKNILSFVSSQMVVKIVLSADCDECWNLRGGQCRLDVNKWFYCHKGTFQINFWTNTFLLNASLFSTHKILNLVFYTLLSWFPINKPNFSMHNLDTLSSYVKSKLFPLIAEVTKKKRTNRNIKLGVGNVPFTWLSAHFYKFVDLECSSSSICYNANFVEDSQNLIWLI